MCHAFDFSLGKEIVWKIVFFFGTMVGMVMISTFPNQRAGTAFSRQISNHHLFKLVIFCIKTHFR